MSLMGIDVGTTGCKAAVFSSQGHLLALAYEEYDVQRPEPGWAELDARAVWAKIQQVIRQVAAAGTDPVQAVCVSSCGEAVVPVTAGRQVLGPSILNFDVRGEEYLDFLAEAISPERLYRINGNTLGNHYGLTKLMWIKEHRPELYRAADKFLLWGSFVSFMLGAEPVVDYSLANRTLLFDLDRQGWSDELLEITGIDAAKLPRTAPSGTVIGQLAAHMAASLGLPAGVTIVSGAHDQNATAIGCGVVQEGQAAYSMGTFICLTPVFQQRREPVEMMRRGLNTEHHAAPGRYVSFIYNQGGSLVKWFRDTFAAEDHRQAKAAGRDIYTELTAEIPGEPGKVLVLPHFTTTGPPKFISDSSGVLAGLRLETSRGEILKGILEGTTFYLKECVDDLPEAGIQVVEFRAAGGGSKSGTWLQICADIFGRPFVRPAVQEAGALGAAVTAGVGRGMFDSFEDGVAAMVRLDRTFEPNPQQQDRYAQRFEHYKRLAPLLEEYLREIA